MKATLLMFALCALLLAFLALVHHQPLWLVAGNGYVAALLIFTAARLQ